MHKQWWFFCCRNEWILAEFVLVLQNPKSFKINNKLLVGGGIDSPSSYSGPVACIPESSLDLLKKRRAQGLYIIKQIWVPKPHIFPTMLIWWGSIADSNWQSGRVLNPSHLFSLPNTSTCHCTHVYWHALEQYMPAGTCGSVEHCSWLGKNVS